MKMDHERCSDLLLPYVLEELEPDASREVEEHLASCDDCRKEHAGLAALMAEPVEPMNDIERASLHRDLSERVSIPAGPGEERARMAWLPQALGVAATLLVVVVGLQALSGSGGDEDAAVSGGAGGGSMDQGAGPEGPSPVTLKLTRAGVREAAPQAGSLGGDDATTDEAADSGDALEAEPEEPEAASSENSFTVRLSERAVESQLKRYARTSETFTKFAAAYRAEDVEILAPSFIEQLANEAPSAQATSQVSECADLVVSSREVPTLPAAAAHGLFRDERSLLLGFAWTAEETGPLDNYVFYVWPVGSCETPSHSQSGRIRTGDR